jgi:hypothetical protein
MKSKTIPHFVPWVRSLYAAIGRDQASHDAPHSPSQPLPTLSPEAGLFPPKLANRQPKQFFSQWFDTWRNRNEGVRQ